MRNGISAVEKRYRVTQSTEACQYPKHVAAAVTECWRYVFALIIADVSAVVYVVNSGIILLKRLQKRYCSQTQLMPVRCETELQITT